jgi:hypothetical protein
LDQEQQNRVLHSLQDFLEESLVRAVGEVDGLTQVVKSVMTRGLTGALDAVIRDLQPEQQLQVNFFDEMANIGQTVGEIIRDSLKKEEVDEKLIDEVLTAVGTQFSNTDGPDFVALTTTPGLLILSS